MFDSAELHRVALDAFRGHLDGPYEPSSAGAHMKTKQAVFLPFVGPFFAIYRDLSRPLLHSYYGGRQPALGAYRPTPTAPLATVPSLCFHQLGEPAFRSKLTLVA